MPTIPTTDTARREANEQAIEYQFRASSRFYDTGHNPTNEQIIPSGELVAWRRTTERKVNLTLNKIPN